MNPHFSIVTDGSAIGNPGPGGWAAVLVNGQSQWEISGSSRWTTISEMELTAALRALHTVPTGSEVYLYSDSEYLIRGMRYLAGRWKRQGWRNRRGLPLKDQKLWQELLLMDRKLVIHWTWIRGHSGHKLQTRADALAYWEARQRMVSLERVA